VTWEVVENEVRQDRLLQLVQHALNVGGTLLLSTLNRRYIPFNHSNLYNTHEFFPKVLNLV